MGTKQNFKTALNELMAGKVASDEEDGNIDYQEEIVKPADPVFKKPTYTSTYSATPSSNISVITADLIIEGNITSKSDIRIDGHIKGNISCAGSIACGGVIEGDIHCASLIMSSCSINGNIVAKSDITIDPESTIIGDVSAHNLVTDGRIKGNIKTSGSATLRENAMLMGNIHAKSISLDAGASLKGTLEVQTADLSDDDFKLKNSTEKETVAPAPEAVVNEAVVNADVLPVAPSEPAE